MKIIKREMIEIDNSRQRKYGVILSYANMGLSMLLMIAYTPYLLRMVGQGEYGVYTLATSIIGYLTVLDLGLGDTLVRYSARLRAEGKDDSDINGLFLLMYIVISAISLFVGIILYDNIDIFFKDSFTGHEINVLKMVYIILLINTVISFPLSVFSSILRAYEKFIYINTINFIKTIIQNLANIVFLYIGYKTVSLAMIALICSVITGVLNIYFAFFVIKMKVTFGKLEKYLYKEIFYFSFFIFLNILVDRLYANTDKIILGKLCNSAAVAVYGIGVTFETFYIQLSTSVSGVFLPKITELSVSDNDNKAISKVFLEIGHIQFLLLFSVMLGFLFWGKEFIYYWAGPDYDDAFYIALIIMIPSIIPLSQNIGISVLRALNKHSIRSVMYLMIAVFNIAVSIPLAIKYQGIGAALGTAIGNLLGQIIFMNWYYWKKIGLDIPAYWKSVIITLLKMIPLIITYYLINSIISQKSMLLLVVKVLLGFIVGLVYEYLTVMTTREKEIIGFLIHINKD